MQFWRKRTTGSLPIPPLWIPFSIANSSSWIQFEILDPRLPERTSLDLSDMLRQSVTQPNMMKAYHNFHNIENIRLPLRSHLDSFCIGFWTLCCSLLVVKTHLPARARKILNNFQMSRSALPDLWCLSPIKKIVVLEQDLDVRRNSEGKGTDVKTGKKPATVPMWWSLVISQDVALQYSTSTKRLFSYYRLQVCHIIYSIDRRDCNVLWHVVTCWNLKLHMTLKLHLTHGMGRRPKPCRRGRHHLTNLNFFRTCGSLL